MSSNGEERPVRIAAGPVTLEGDLSLPEGAPPSLFMPALPSIPRRRLRQKACRSAAAVPHLR
jgi:hypothetical protein